MKRIALLSLFTVALTAAPLPAAAGSEVRLSGKKAPASPIVIAQLQTPEEKRREAYVAEIQNMIATYSREVAQLSRVEQAGGSPSSQFETARKEYVEKVEILNGKLRALQAATPGEIHSLIPPVDAAARDVKAAYTRLQSYAP